VCSSLPSAIVLLDSQYLKVRKENIVMFNRPHAGDNAHGFNALALALAVAIYPLSGVLGKEAIR
jgi:hypothetical protein